MNYLHPVQMGKMKCLSVSAWELNVCINWLMTRGSKLSKKNGKGHKGRHSCGCFVKKRWSSRKNSGSNELIVYVREFLVSVTMKDIRQPPVCCAGGARQATPQRSPQFLSMGPDVDSRFFSCLEADGAKTFFQFSPPARDKGRPFTKKHWEEQVTQWLWLNSIFSHYQVVPGSYEFTQRWLP